ncbi:MAG: c-type cytochrome [Alphaproteobacteria bacterium]|nr:c-type cytochrome [Alphaproteobacteria bacterium]
MHILFLLACSTDTPAPHPEPDHAGDHTEKPAPAADAGDDKLRSIASSVLGKLPANAGEVDPKLVTLGKQLYFDTRLSKDDTISCNSCHQLAKYGVDGEPTSPGVGGGRGGRNSPTVYNAALHMAQFWDGREPDVEHQALGPILNPIEMAMPDGDTVVAKVGAIEGYKTAFADAFPDGLTYKNIGLAIGAFERTLLTPAPFDAWVAGDDAALTADQKAGFDLFVSTGCTSCHSGPLVGGGQYQKLGLVHPWTDDDDKGREDVTKNESDRQMFKVPSLRNIDKTGPYFHSGKVASLDEAITKMAHHQLGKELKPEEVASIKTFLGSLTGPLDPEKVAPPTLP